MLPTAALVTASVKLYEFAGQRPISAQADDAAFALMMPMTKLPWAR